MGIYFIIIIGVIPGDEASNCGYVSECCFKYLIYILVTVITYSCFMLFSKYFVTLTSCVSLGCRWLPLDLLYIAAGSD